MDAVPALQCEIKPSRLVMRCSALIHCLVILFVLASAIGGLLQCLLVLTVLLLALRTDQHLSLQYLAVRIDDQQWAVEDVSLREPQDLDPRRYVIWPYLIILYRVKRISFFTSKAIVLGRDSLSAEDFRRLTVRLRFNPC
jgi:hypothetical protein